MRLHEEPLRAARRPACCPELAAAVEASDSEESTACGSSRAGTPPEARAPRVRFCDAALAEVVEVESWKEHNRFTAENRARADSAWRSELLERLQGARGEAERRGAVGQLEGVVLELASAGEETGSLAVQRALELAPPLQRVRLVGELHGWVPALFRSAHGGAVLRACLRLLPRACGFLAREVTGHTVECLRLQGGAEVVGELLRQLPTARTARIQSELLVLLPWLCYQPQGGHVIGSLLQCGTREHQQQTAEAMSSQMQLMDEFQRGVVADHIRAAHASRDV